MFTESRKIPILL